MVNIKDFKFTGYYQSFRVSPFAYFHVSFSKLGCTSISQVDRYFPSLITIRILLYNKEMFLYPL